MVFIATVLPLASLGAMFGTGGMTISRFPPIVCLGADTDASFYSFVLPLSIISALGIPLIIVILGMIITKAGSLRTQFMVSENIKLNVKLELLWLFDSNDPEEHD